MGQKRNLREEEARARRTLAFTTAVFLLLVSFAFLREPLERLLRR